MAQQDQQFTGKYNKADIQRMFGLNQVQLEKLIDKAGDDLPTGEHPLDKRRVYTDLTVEYFEEVFGLPLKEKGDK